ncbi:unnamed protein product, partial [Hymenolepis diminuta]
MIDFASVCFFSLVIPLGIFHQEFDVLSFTNSREHHSAFLSFLHPFFVRPELFFLIWGVRFGLLEQLLRFHEIFHFR